MISKLSFDFLKKVIHAAIAENAIYANEGVEAIQKLEEISTDIALRSTIANTSSDELNEDIE